MDRRRLNGSTEVTKEERFDIPANNEPTALQKGPRTGYVQRSAGRRQQYRAPYTYEPFRCSYCNSPRALVAFAHIYADGSFLSRYRKGLIIKTGWAETRRQSVLAMQCAPPKKRRVCWPMLLILTGLGAGPISAIHPSIGPQLDTILSASSLPELSQLLWRFCGTESTTRKECKPGTTAYCKRCSRVTILSPRQE
jgi:hypothetical protein